jgi:ribosomal protein L16 Arg81 hydroxylase
MSGQFASILAPRLGLTFLRHRKEKSFTYVERLFDPAWVEGLELPSTEWLLPALAGEQGFWRTDDRAAVEQAYHNQPRTKVYENLDTKVSGWIEITALQLARLARCRVVASLFESSCKDAATVPHFDDWYVVAVQLRGAKVWTLSEGREGLRQEVITRPGDVLLMPSTVYHAVRTPLHSVHLSFAVLDQEPIA